jgi:carbon-monoxide dehydrogenase small subunit
MTSQETPGQETPGQPARTGRPRPVRAGLGELVETRMTVNGTSATLALPARVTLADALRDHLGLTGTHLGCEHGVCGMCTVLVDGEAARACLLFAAQLDGAEIVTVEGLGRPGDLHPLQESFGRNHALQCGFCTPGFLMSAYSLLTSKPELGEEDLPGELSGVICRCTGYRNILAAVRETLRAYPDGIPAPGNCAPRTLTGRATGRVTGQAGNAAAGRAPHQVTAGGTAGRAGIVLPAGDPAIAVTVRTEIAAVPERVWQVLGDPHRLARCLPGAELTEDLGGEKYQGRVAIRMGPVRLQFAGTAEIAERDDAAKRLVLNAAGAEEKGRGQASMVVTATLVRSGRGTKVNVAQDIQLSGAAAQYGRGMISDVSSVLMRDFATTMQDRIERVERGESAEQIAAAGTSPASGLALGMRAAVMALTRVFRRFFVPYHAPAS